MLEVMIILLSLLLFAIGVGVTNFYILTLSIFALYAADFIMTWKKRRDRGVVLLFLLSFFTFLLGKMLIYMFTGMQWWADFTAEETLVVIIGIYLALLFFPVGVVLSEHTRLSTRTASNTDGLITITPKILSIQRISLTLFWATLAANAYEIISRVLFVVRNSYVDAYLSYGGVNIVISRISDINKISFFLFLATIPSKQNAKRPIIIWTLLNMVSILSGGRTTAVITLLVMFYYFVYRDSHRKEEETEWLTARMKRIIIIATPIIIVFLGAWNYLRNSRNVDLGFLGLFFDFFESQGGAYKHLAYAQRYAGELPQKFYTFGPVINFFRGNFFVSRLTGFRMPAQNTVAAAMGGYSFGQAISYISQPWNYLAGLGMGSSYLAELYYDFGYLGIIAFNILLGVLFSKLSRVSPHRPMGIFFMLVILDSTLNLPRNACMAWFTSITSITLWFTLLLVYLLTYKNRFA